MRRALVSIISGIFGGYLAANMMPLLISVVQSSVDLPTVAAGLLATALLVTAAVTGWGLARRAGTEARISMAITGSLIASGGFIIAGLIANPWMIAMGFIIVGLGSGALVASASAALSSTGNPDRVATLAILFGTIAVSVLLAVLPAITKSRAPTFLIFAGVMLAVAVGVRWLPLASDTASNLRPANTTVVVFAVGVGLYAMSESGAWAFASRLAEWAGVSENSIPITLSVAVASGILGSGCAVLLGARLGELIPIAGFIGLGMIGKIAAALTMGQVSFTIGLFLWCMTFPPTVAYILALSARGDKRGSTAAIAGSALAMGGALGPAVIGLLVRQETSTPLVVAQSVLCIASIVLTILAGRAMINGQSEAAAS